MSILTDLADKQKEIIIESLEAMAGFWTTSKLRGTPVSDDDWLKMYNQNLAELKELFFKGDSRFNYIVNEYVNALKTGSIPSLFLIKDETMKTLGMLTAAKGLISAKANKNMVSSLGKARGNISISNSDLGIEQSEQSQPPKSRLAKFGEKLSSMMWGKFDPNSSNTSAIDRIDVLDRKKYIDDAKYRAEKWALLKETRAALRRGEAVSVEQLRLVREISKLEKKRLENEKFIENPEDRMTAGGVAVYEISKSLLNLGKGLFSKMIQPKTKETQTNVEKKIELESKEDNENNVKYIMASENGGGDAAKEEADETADERFETQTEQAETQIEHLKSIDEGVHELIDKSESGTGSKEWWALLGAAFAAFFKRAFSLITGIASNAFKMLRNLLSPLSKVLDFAKILGRFIPLILRFTGPIGLAITGIMAAVDLFSWLIDKDKEKALESQGEQAKFDENQKKAKQAEANKLANETLEKNLANKNIPEAARQLMIESGRKRGFEYNPKTGKMEPIPGFVRNNSETEIDVETDEVDVENFETSTSIKSGVIEERTIAAEQASAQRQANLNAAAIAPIINAPQTSNIMPPAPNYRSTTKDNPRNRDNSLLLYLNSRVVKFS